MRQWVLARDQALKEDSTRVRLFSFPSASIRFWSSAKTFSIISNKCVFLRFLGRRQPRRLGGSSSGWCFSRGGRTADGPARGASGLTGSFLFAPPRSDVFDPERTQDSRLLTTRSFWGSGFGVHPETPPSDEAGGASLLNFPQRISLCTSLKLSLCRT